MTVYVDDWRQPATVGPITGRWSHLTADTVEELHAFASRLGIPRAFQEHPTDPLRHHYDVTDPLRTLAIELGAVAEPWRDAGRRRRRRRADAAVAARPAAARPADRRDGPAATQPDGTLPP